MNTSQINEIFGISLKLHKPIPECKNIGSVNTLQGPGGKKLPVLIAFIMILLAAFTGLVYKAFLMVTR